MIPGLDVYWQDGELEPSVFCCFTYVELLDKSYYLNHYYFVSLVAFMLCWLPTTAKTPHVPPLAVTSIRLLLAVVYFYAGLAKLNSDWLLNAQPLAMWLPQHSSFPVLGPFFATREVAFLFSWAGAALTCSRLCPLQRSDSSVFHPACDVPCTDVDLVSYWGVPVVILLPQLCFFETLACARMATPALGIVARS